MSRVFFARLESREIKMEDFDRPFRITVEVFTHTLSRPPRFFYGFIQLKLLPNKSRSNTKNGGNLVALWRHTGSISA